MDHTKRHLEQEQSEDEPKHKQRRMDIGLADFNGKLV